MFGSSKLLLTMEDINISSENAPSKTAEMPYFKVFPRDEIADSRIQLLELDEFGAYQRLKFQIWIDGGNLPFDERFLAKLLRISPKKFQKIWKEISPLFSIIDEKLTIADFEMQRAKYSDFIEQRRAAGQKSATKRGNDRSTDVQRPLNDTKSESESESKSESKAETKESVKHSLSENDAFAPESESEIPLTPIDFKNYVLAKKAAGKHISDVDAYVSKLYADPIAHFHVRQFKETGITDYEEESNSNAAPRKIDNQTELEKAREQRRANRANKEAA